MHTDLENSLNQTKGITTSSSGSITVSSNKCECPKKHKITGLYVSSFCNGIRDITEQYRKEIARLEEDLLENSYMTVTEMRAKVEPFRAIFQALDSMIFKIQAQSKSSVLIVEFVKMEYDHHVHLQNTLKK